MLTLEGVSKRFPGGTVALHEVDLSVPRGQFCVLLGPSGAGKSTLLRLVNGLAETTTGSVHVDGVTMGPRTVRRIRRGLGTIHQQFHLVKRSTVLQNVLCGSLGHIGTARALLGLFPVELQRKACRLLHEVGLGEEFLYRRAESLSGGQQQRVAIARAFLLDPLLVLADEPVASLDPAISASILELLKQSSRRHGTTVLCSLHQVELARAFADRLVALRAGRVFYDGGPEELTDSVLAEVYGSS